ncbi:MAG: NADH-quinone oxidoreductase subunit L, partial [Mycobacterium sp.]
ILALGSAGAGAALAVGGTLTTWLEPVVGTHEVHHVIPIWAITTITLTIVAIGVGAAVRKYRSGVTSVASEWVSAGTWAARQDLYGDVVNEQLFMKPGQRVTAVLVRVDRAGIDGAVEGIARLVAVASSRVRLLQTGFARSYALSVFAGATLVLATLILVRVW